ncbi:MAG: polysaccharide deacetylase family protein [Campylobacteraceae bacterium]
MSIFLILSFVLFFDISLRFNWWRKNVDLKYPRVYMYHSIDSHLGNKRRDKWRVKKEDFEKQLEWLNKNGWRSFFVGELVEVDNLPEKSFAITFDDGYLNNFTNAFDLLKKYNFKATIYLVSDKILNDWEKFEDKNFDKLLNKEDILLMQYSRLVEFGAHTLTHKNLNIISSKEAKIEIENSKKSVENLCNKECKTFAYPYGKYNNEIIDLVKNAGFTSAVLVKRGVFKKDKQFEIERIGILGTENFFDFYLKTMKIRNKF